MKVEDVRTLQNHEHGFFFDTTHFYENDAKWKKNKDWNETSFVIVCFFYFLETYLIGKSWSVFPTFVLYDLHGEFLLFAQQCINECAISYLT